MWQRVSRGRLRLRHRWSFVALALVSVLLVLPSSNLQIFSGLPFSAVPEFAALVLVLPLCCSRALRRLANRVIRTAPPGLRAGVVLVGVIAVLAKVILLASGTYTGLAACYTSPVAPPPAGPCERSYENPAFRFTATRIDPALSFGPMAGPGGQTVDLANWDLSFFNSLRFNIYHEPGKILRARLPLAVTWRGNIQAPEPQSVLLTYTGEAVVRIGQTGSLQLPPRYGPAPATEEIRVPAGRHPLVISYRFDDGYRIGQERSRGPYATFRLRALAPAAQRFRLGNGSRAWTWVAGFADGVTAAFLAGIAWLFLAVIKRRRLVFGGLVAAAATAALRWWPRSSPLPGPDMALLFLSCAVLIYAVVTYRRRTILETYLALAWLAMCNALLIAPAGVVLYRSAANDPLAYESFARSILETGSLEAGERVFYFQPGFRYLRFLEHVVFGDSDRLLAAFALTCLNVAFFRLILHLLRGTRPSRARHVQLAAVSLLVLIFLNSGLARAIADGLSEYPTWIFFFLLFPILVGPGAPDRPWLSSLLLGLSFFVRPNQAPGVLGLFALSVSRLSGREALRSSAILVAVAMLPLAHNVVYGGEFVVLTASATIPWNLVLSPGDVLSVADDPLARAALWRQLEWLLCLRPQDHLHPQFWSLHGLQLAWLAATIRAVILWRHLTLRTRLLHLVPLLYLGVHVFYQAHVYYPRHLVIGYIAAGVVAMYSLAAPNWEKSPRESTHIDHN